jgi:predicted nucleic acid-binding protein
LGVKISGTVGIVIEVRKRNKSTRKVECDLRSLDLEGSRLG